MMKWLSIVIMFIVFIALLAVTLGNTHSVDFNLIGLPTTKWPLSLICGLRLCWALWWA